MGVGPYFSLSRFWPVSWKVYVSATQFSGGISRQNGWMDDLPGLDKYKDPTTGRHIFSWTEVLGPCHFP